MTKKLIYIIGSALIGIAALLVVVFAMMMTGSLDAAPTKLVYRTSDAEKCYDGAALVATEWELISGELKEGHTARVQVTGSQTGVGISDNHISVTIWDQKGGDVTEYYRLEYQPGQLTVTPRYVEISATDAEKVYDGQPLVGTEWTVTDGSLAEDQRAQVILTGSMTGVGQGVCQISATVVDAAGNDVSANYNIACNNATLTVHKRHLTLLSDSDEKIYDGIPLSNDGFSISAGELPEGHQIAVINQSSITHFGEKENKFMVTVYDENGADVTSNYELAYLYGKLRILKVKLTLQTESVTRIYDGTPLVCHEWKTVSGRVLESETLIAEFTGSIVDCGEALNEAVFKVVDQNGVDVTQNYDIQTVFGSLVVINRGFTLSSGASTKEYDGTPLTNEEVEILGGSLAEGHEMTLMFTGSQTLAGNSDNLFTVVVTDQNGVDVTKNYMPEYVYGKLTVTKRGLTLSSGTSAKEYDGSPLTNEEVEILGGSLAEGHEMTIVCTGIQTNVGESENSFTVIITDQSGTDVTANYALRYAYGKLTVTPRSLTIMTSSAVKEYDGTPLFAQEYQIVSESQLLDGHSITTVVMPSTVTNVWDNQLENRISELVISDTESNDVTANYDIEFIYGKLWVLPREITVRTGSASKIYDGTELTDDTWKIVSQTQLVENHSLQLAISGTRTEVGESENIVAEAIILNENQEEVTSNYSITYQYGALVVKEGGGGAGGGGGEGSGGGGEGSGGEGEGSGGGGEGSGGEGEGSGGGGEGSGGGGEGSGGEGEGSGGGGGVSGSGGGGDSSAISGPPSDMEEVVMLRIKTEKDINAVYLREMSYGLYNGREWMVLPSYDQLLEGTYNYNYLTAIALNNNGRISIPMEIQNVNGGAYHLPYFTAAEMYRYDIPSDDVRNVGDGSDYALYFYDYAGYGEGIEDSLGEYADEELLYREFVYENYLDVDDATRAFMEGIIAEEEFSLRDADIIYQVAEYIQMAAVYNMDYDRLLDKEENIAVAFLSEYKEGICQHYATAATLLFRTLGIPARYTVGYMGSGVADEWSDVTNKQAHAWVDVYIDGVGWVYVEVTGSGPSSGSGGGGGGGGGGSGMKKKLVIRPADVYQVFEAGKTLVPDGRIVGLEELEAKGYYYEATVSGKGSGIGITKSVIQNFTLYNAQHEDVTDDFNITMRPGKIHVYVQELYVATESDEKIYDGTPLSNAECSYEGNLLSGHTIELFTCTGSLTNAGKAVNNYKLVIVNADGEDVTDYYRVHATYGILTVTQRQIHIIANSGSKAYDGEALVDSGYTLEGEVAEGDTLEVRIVGSQTYVGRSANAVVGVDVTNEKGESSLPNYVITYENGELFVMPPTQ